MRKVLKIIIIIIVILILLYAIFCFRNYFIIKKLLEKSRNLDVANNYKIVQNISATTVDILGEFYLKDNNYLYKENRTWKEDSENELDNYAIWYDSNTNEFIEFMYDDNNNLVQQEVVHKLETLPIDTITFYKHDNFSDGNFYNILKTIISKEGDYYKITTYFSDEKDIIYVNQDSGVIEKFSIVRSDNTTYTVTSSYEANVVTDEMIEKPIFNISE